MPDLPDGEIENRNKAREADVPFLESLRNAREAQNYLGDVDIAQTLLRIEIAYLFEKFEDATDKEKTRAVEGVAARFARTMLGKNKQYQPVPGWNAPGKIDVALASVLNLTDEDPMERLEHAFILFVDAVLDVADYAGEPGVLDEQWAGTLDGLYLQWALLFTGQSAISQDAMIVK